MSLNFFLISILLPCGHKIPYTLRGECVSCIYKLVVLRRKILRQWYRPYDITDNGLFYVTNNGLFLLLKEKTHGVESYTSSFYLLSTDISLIKIPGQEQIMRPSLLRRQLFVIYRCTGVRCRTGQQSWTGVELVNKVGKHTYFYYNL